MALSLYPEVATRFRLGQLIARGGMAAVYEAFDDEGNVVAAKIPHHEMMASPIARERFLREASLLCALRSPFIVRGLGVAAAGDQRPMLLMERLHGEDCASTLEREGTLALTRAVLSVVQVCAALSALHRVGVVHRDLKPSNIFVTRAPDDLGPAVLLDLGVIKSHGDASVTHQGCVVGSPAYMAPEQMLGQDDLDHRADIWSVGVVLYELLTGRVPFEGHNIMHVLSRALFNEKTSVRALRPDVSPEIDAIIDRCLAVEPNQRFTSAIEVAHALLPLLPPWIARRVVLPADVSGDRPSGAYGFGPEDAEVITIA